MKRTLLFMTCVLASLTMSAQGSDTDISDYIPFVEPYKGWFVMCSDSVSGYYLDRYELTNEEVVKEGKTYLRMNHGKASVHEFNFAGLLREEDRKVYFYDSDLQKEFLMFDYSLKAGDTYETYSYDEQKMVTYKVLSVGDYTEGPEIKTYYFDEASGRIDVLKRYRYLRKWTICRTDDDSCQKTWIEGVGSPEGPLPNLYDSYTISSRSYLAWVKYLVGENLYLPFSYHDEFCQVHGCDLPTRAAERTEESDHQFTYEMEGDRLHVYGKAVFPGPCNYAIFIEEPTDNPLVRKLHFVTQLILPTTLDIRFFYETDFYLSGFNPNINYIVVDKWGEEHPVINKTPQLAYRPFVEEGKVWKVGDITSGNPAQCVEHFYFDGDTIVGGKACKKMMCQRYVNPDFHFQRPALYYVGAWYEVDKKVYFCVATNNQFKLMYDFSIEDNGTFQTNGLSYVIGPKQTGGIKGFKGVHRGVREYGDGEDTFRCAPWLEGVGGVYGPPTTNVFNVELADPMWFLMSCTVGDEVIYFNGEYEDGATPEEVVGARKDRIDFTHTIKIKPKSRTAREAEAQSLYGEYNSLQLGINLNALDEAYQVSITDEAGKVVYEKTVNAGNIVGLNIDISAYAKGRYIVTVENSNESFTGQFETQTTGISLTPALFRREGAIYNLQGQRINSLRKGLNIVDGRKVYVK